MSEWNGAERRADMVELATLANRLQSLHTDVSDIKGALKDLTVAINKLAIIEERQSTITASIERAFTAIAKVEDRLSSIEKDIPNNHRIGAWVDRAVFALLGIAVMFIFDQFRGK